MQLLSVYSGYEGDESNDELTRVCEWLQIINGKSNLVAALRDIFDKDFTEDLPAPDFVARLARNSYDEGVSPYVIFTTNYDGILERDLRKQHLDYVVISHIPSNAPTDQRSLYVVDDSKEVLAKVPPDDLDLDDFKDYGALVYKPHGNLYAKIGSHVNEVVISETDYISRLQRNLVEAIPAQLAEHCAERGFLFLGYSLADWNMRSIVRSVHRRDRHRRPDIVSYLVDRPNPNATRRYWEKQDIALHEDDLVDFCTRVAADLGI